MVGMIVAELRRDILGCHKDVFMIHVSVLQIEGGGGERFGWYLSHEEVWLGSSFW